MTLKVATEIAKEEYGTTRQQMRTALRILLEEIERLRDALADRDSRQSY